jgi:hypothetical protein
VVRRVRWLRLGDVRWSEQRGVGVGWGRCICARLSGSSNAPDSAECRPFTINPSLVAFAILAHLQGAPVVLGIPGVKTPG